MSNNQICNPNEWKVLFKKLTGNGCNISEGKIITKLFRIVGCWAQKVEQQLIYCTESNWKEFFKLCGEPLTRDQGKSKMVI